MQENEDTALHHNSNGDLIATSLITWASVNPISKKIRPLLSPMYNTDYYMALLSPIKQKDIPPWYIFQVFQASVNFRFFF